MADHSFLGLVCPSIQTASLLIVAVDREPGEIRVTITGEPKPNVTWEPLSDGVEVLEDYSLRFPDIRRRHDTFYTVTATNRCGSVNKTIRFRVYSELISTGDVCRFASSLLCYRSKAT